MDPKRTYVLVDGSWGIYVPQRFAENYTSWPMSDEQRSILKDGPNQESYFDVWLEVTQNSTVTDKEGTVWHLWQDGDLFACPEEEMELWL